MLVKKVKSKGDDDKVELLKSKGKTGHTIRRSEYEMFKNFILETLKTVDQLNLFELLDKCNEQFAHKFGGEAGWYILNIKQDLQAQGLIQIKKTNKHVQLVSLKAQKNLLSNIDFKSR